VSLKKRNRRAQLALSREELARQHAEAYLAGERARWRLSFRDRAMVRRIQRERARTADGNPYGFIP
jgi:hypothetical protein